MDGASGKDESEQTTSGAVVRGRDNRLRVSAEGRMEPDRSNCADLPRPECPFGRIASLQNRFWEGLSGRIECDSICGAELRGALFRDSSDGRSATLADGRSDWPTVGLAQPSV